MFKRIKLIIMSFVIGAVLIQTTACFAASKGNLLITNLELNINTEPTVINGVVMVPLRPILQIFQYNVDYDSDNQSVRIYDSQGYRKEINFKLGSGRADITEWKWTQEYDWYSHSYYSRLAPKGSSIQFELTPRLINDVMFVPLSFIGETMGIKTVWDDNEKRIILGAASFNEKAASEPSNDSNDKNTAEPINKPEEEYKGVKNEIGNTPGNLLNEGYVAIQGDWIYYRNQALFGNLYKMYKDGTQRTKLTGDNVKYINVTGNWVYYVNDENGDDADYIYKVKLDGTQRTLIRDFSVESMCVAGDSIYYVKAGSLYKMNIDGNNEKKLNASADYVFAYEDWIYYSNYKTLYRMKTDGSYNSKVVDSDGFSFGLDGSQVFYLETEYASTYVGLSTAVNVIYSMKLDSTKRAVQLTSEDNFEYIYTINVLDGWIYYREGLSSPIYKIRTDGSGKTKVTPNYANSNFYIAGDWLFYIDNSSDELYMIKVDGTQNQLVEPL